MTPARAPLVSIGVPVLDGAATLERALGDLLGQTCSDIEIIVSDNASRDRTGAIADQIASSDDRVRVVHQPSRLPILESFAAVFELAQGELFMWAAHDDRWDADHVRRLVDALEGSPAAALACGIPEYRDDTGRVHAVKHDVAALARGDVVDRLETFIRQREDLGKANLMYGLIRRGVLLEIDPRSFWRRDPRRFDYHLVLAVLAHGDVAVDDALRFHKTEHPPTRSAPLHRKVQTTWRAAGWLRAYRGVVDELGLDDAARRRLHAAVRDRELGLVVDRARRVIGLRT